LEVIFLESRSELSHFGRRGHSDASYLSAPKARSRAGGYFFLGSIPQDSEPIIINGAIHITCTIPKLVAASAAKAKLGTLFLNAQEAKVLWLVLEELRHPQPPTPIHIDNTTTVGIVNNTIKRQRSRAMEMRYFWLLDGEVQKPFHFYYQPGQENLGGYPSKHHSADIHQHACPYWSNPKTNFVFVIHKHLFVICVCVALFFHSKINCMGRHKSHSRLKKTYIGYINRIQQKNIRYFFIFFSGEIPHHPPPQPHQQFNTTDTAIYCGDDVLLP
jgi:hypothetical protein